MTQKKKWGTDLYIVINIRQHANKSPKFEIVNFGVSGCAGGVMVGIQNEKSANQV